MNRDRARAEADRGIGDLTPADCWGCDGTGKLTADGAVFAICDACSGTGQCPRPRNRPSGVGGFGSWDDIMSQRPDMASVHDAVRKANKRGRRMPR